MNPFSRRNSSHLFTPPLLGDLIRGILQCISFFRVCISPRLFCLLLPQVNMRYKDQFFFLYQTLFVQKIVSLISRRARRTARDPTPKSAFPPSLFRIFCRPLWSLNDFPWVYDLRIRAPVSCRAPLSPFFVFPYSPSKNCSDLLWARLLWDHIFVFLAGNMREKTPPVTHCCRITPFHSGSAFWPNPPVALPLNQVDTNDTELRRSELTFSQTFPFYFLFSFSFSFLSLLVSVGRGWRLTCLLPYFPPLGQLVTVVRLPPTRLAFTDRQTGTTVISPSSRPPF